MITARTRKHKDVKVDFLVNRGGWFGKTWLIEVGMGISSCFVVVEADSEYEAIYELADSRRYYLIEETDPSEVDRQIREGNNRPVNLDNVGIWRCEVNYFAKKEV